jgi:hypothetical protein
LKSERTCLGWVHECADEAYQGHGGLEYAKNGIVDRRKGGAGMGHGVLLGRVRTRALFKMKYTHNRVSLLSVA